MSYQNGIFFMGKTHISCAYNEQGKIVEWVKPIDSKSLLQASKQVIVAMPLWFKLLSMIFFLAIFLPKVLVTFGGLGWNGLPYYSIFYYIFGTHFIFPKELRKYHGAEHKVFSFSGVKAMYRAHEIKQAKITNRYCSTNIVVVYFSLVITLTLLASLYLSFYDAIALASYGALLITPLLNKKLNHKWLRFIRGYVLNVSYYLQEKVTTTEPDDFHIRTAIRSYRRLALKEFPSELRERIQPKEEKRMAIVDITIIPIGTDGPSVSQHVVEIHKVLERYQDQINYQLTPMSTIIEGELPILFEVIQAIHEVPFSKGIQRVATNIRIDDRRDKIQTMATKIQSVEEKLHKEE
ncbi:DUF1385 domain-containing protein [Anaerobacillus alkaliphilus]|uniref:DUF1385 domain-containing protein n=2 Tax=Anaerobacillus alkaliphilus TaxID=1548597 RepID=A0A4Q0VQZ5_9BACI|nr:DUF1385 domain-containing protein [Anaerobacillus alkaliphilus]